MIEIWFYFSCKASRVAGMSVNLPLVVMVLITAALSGSSAEGPGLNNIVGSRMTDGARRSFSSGNDTERNPLRELPPKSVIF